MKKRIFALLLAAMLPLGAAIADEPLTDGTVLVDWVDGQETYTASVPANSPCATTQTRIHTPRQLGSSGKRRGHCPSRRISRC